MERHRTSVTSPRSGSRVRAGDRERDHEPVHMIDMGTALDLLFGAQDCIVGHALDHAGVSVRALEAMRDDGVDDLYLDGRFPVHLTLGAWAVLRAAQQSQDRGCRWGDVLTQATAVCLRVLDLVPDAAFEFAAQPPRTPTAAPSESRTSATGDTYRSKRGMGMSNGTPDQR
jgi:hypothetical protein